MIVYETELLGTSPPFWIGYLSLLPPPVTASNPVLIVFTLFANSTLLNLELASRMEGH